jgi:hypothetical protein
MAVIGEASIVIKPVTSGFASGLKKGLAAGNKEVQSSGARLGDDFTKNFNRGMQRRRLFGPSWFRQADMAAKRLTGLVRIGRVLGPALAFLGGSVASLGAGFFALGSAVGSAAPALIVLPASLLAIAQAAIVLKAAFAGVGKAISAGLNAGGGGGGGGNGEAVKNALEQLADARERLARATEDAAERIAEANDKVIDAENDYIDAQFDSAKAAKALSKAREEALEDLQQLRFETEDAAISEGKARLEFEKSRESLQRVQDLPPNSRARREAELAFAEADLNLRRAIDTNADLKKASAEATAAGVEGSDKVLNAQEELADAKQREADAAAAVADAVADAAKVERDALRSIADAQTAVARAIDDVAAAKKSGAGGSDAYAAALAKLSPAAQDFVKYMVDTFIPTLKEIRDVAATNLFPKLTTALETLRTKLFTEDFKERIGKTAGVIGDVAIELANVVTEQDNIDRLGVVWDTNDKLIGNFGTSVGNLYTGFLTLLSAASPLITEFGLWIEEITGAWKESIIAKEKTGELATMFDTARDAAKKIGKIIGNIAGGLMDMGKAATGPGSGGQMLLDAMVEGSQKFKDFTSSADGQNKLEEYFRKASENALAVSGLIGEIAKAIGKLGDNEGVGILAGKLQEAVKIFGEVGEKLTDPAIANALGDTAIIFAELMNALTESGGIATFFETLNTILTPIKDFFASGFGQMVLKVVGPVLATASAIGLVASVAGFFFKGAIGTVGKLFGLANTLLNVFLGKQLAGAVRYKIFSFAVEAQYWAMKQIKMAAFYVQYGLYSLYHWIKEGVKLAAFYVQYAAYSAAHWAKEALKSAAFYLQYGILAAAHWIAETARSVAHWVAEGLRSAAFYIQYGIMAAAHWIAETARSVAHWIAEALRMAAFYIQYAAAAVAHWAAEAVRAIAGWVAETARMTAFYVAYALKAVAHWVAEAARAVVHWVAEGARMVAFYVAYALSSVAYWLAETARATAYWVAMNLKAGAFFVFAIAKAVIFNAVMLLNPIFLIGAAIALIIGGFVLLYQKYKPFRDAVQAVVDYFKTIWKLAQNIAGAVGNFFGGGGGGGGATAMAEGGVVKPSRYGTLAVIGEAGRSERVEPLDPNGLSNRDKAMINMMSGGAGGAGPTINVYPSEGMDERQLAAVVSRQLAFQMRKGSM